MTRRCWSLAAILIVVFGVTLPIASQAAVTSTGIYQSINAARRRLHVPTLRHDVRLDAAARIRAKAILASGTLNHGAKPVTAITIMRQVGYRARVSGELLAADYMTAAQTVAAWGYSSLHRRILADARYRDIGIAVIRNPKPGFIGTITVVLLGRNAGL